MRVRNGDGERRKFVRMDSSEGGILGPKQGRGTQAQQDQIKEWQTGDFASTRMPNWIKSTDSLKMTGCQMLYDEDQNQNGSAMPRPDAEQSKAYSLKKR
jgi:hypothetical protein